LEEALPAHSPRPEVMIENSIPVLECLDIEKSFGATSVLKRARLTVKTGEIHALLGGNGAGKSTLIRIVSGSIPADGGSVRVAGATDFQQSSIAVVFQELALLPHLTVAENIDLPNRKNGFAPAGGRKPYEAAFNALSQIDGVLAGTVLGTLVADLDLHQRQLVEIARALASGARLILLDEPTANLTFGESERLFAIMRRLARSGISLVIVSHRMNEIRAIADVCTILRDGKTVVDRKPMASIDDEQIVEAMGQKQLTEAEQAKAGPTASRRPAQRVTNATRLALAHGAIRVAAASGDILGLAGAPAGPGTLLDHLTGVRPSSEWEIMRDGRPLRFASPSQAVRAGIGYVTGDRANKGILSSLPILDNIVAATRVARRRLFASAEEVGAASRSLDRLSIKASSIDAMPSSLSGGTQQKLLLARWLDDLPDILVLEEPTRGVDIGTKRDIYDIVRQAAASGAIVVWWSTEFAELAAVCNSVISFDLSGRPVEVLEEGYITEVTLAKATGMAA